MRLLPSEQKKRIEAAKDEFTENGKLRIDEPCDCGNRVQHNNGGNYHEIIFLKKDNGRYFVKYETTCELVAPAEWEEIELYQAFQIIEENADWL